PVARQGTRSPDLFVRPARQDLPGIEWRNGSGSARCRIAILEDALVRRRVAAIESAGVPVVAVAVVFAAGTDVLAAVGVDLPRTERRAIAHLVDADRLRIGRRFIGLGFGNERDPL